MFNRKNEEFFVEIKLEGIGIKTLIVYRPLSTTEGIKIVRFTVFLPFLEIFCFLQEVNP